ncbi:unnamed protein product [Adineta steineri]|uniref:F-box domain-containing protein n=1 Tax=Adineta steineri TaxID=433720 RepID=A0A814H3L3_9BILA|nr:unnamed protein product [Adineta steineri]
MNTSLFEDLANDILSEIIYYLSPTDVLQSFPSLNKRFSNLITNEHLWHISIGDSRMPLMIFIEHSHSILKLIGNRVISLRLNLMNTIGGWSIISSSLHYHQTLLLRRLHLIDIKPNEFDKLLSNHFVRQLHTLLVDVTPSNPFRSLKTEGLHLVRVCSRMPLLRICRLPFNYNNQDAIEVVTYPLKSYMMLSSLLNPNQLRNLSIGIHSSYFLEQLLLCIPLIEKLSFSIEDQDINMNGGYNKIILPTAIDAHHLKHLSSLHMNCLNNISFHRIVSLLSSLFNQLTHLSLKLEADTLVYGSMIISGDTIQKLIIDRLQRMATYSLNLLLYVRNDLKEKRVFNLFRRMEFIQREKPKVVIRECYDRSNLGTDTHCFIVFTLPYNDTTLLSHMFSNDFEKSCQVSTAATNLFPHTDTLRLYGYKKTNRIRDLVKCESSVSSFIPWSLISKIEINDSEVITQHTLKSLLEKAYNVDILDIVDHRGIIIRTMLYNKENYGTRINQQIKSLKIMSESWKLDNVKRFCTLVSNQFCNLQIFSFTIHDSYYVRRNWKPSRIEDGKNKWSKRIVNLIYFLVDHLQHLVYLRIFFCNMHQDDMPYFLHLVRRQLHQYPLSRFCRLRCSSNNIQIWL